MAKGQTITLTININGKGSIKSTTAAVKELNKSTKQATMTASEYDRGIKGVAGSGKTATNNFAKQAQGMGGLVHVYATVAANVWALTAAFNVLKSNFDLSIMAKSAEQLSIATGQNFAMIANQMKTLTGGALNFTEAMRQANLGLSGGASGKQLLQITEIANKAANTLGLSVPNAVGRMIQAVTKGEPELVDELGIILRVTKATEDYAKKLNKTATELTTFEKQQAIINQLIDQGSQKFGQVEKQANPYEKLTASVSELARSLISLLSGPLASLASLFANSTSLMGAGMAILVASIGKKAIPEIANLGNIWVKKSKEAADAAEAAIRRVEEAGERIKIRERRIEKRTLEAQKFHGTADPASAFANLTKEGLLYKSLDGRTGVGKEFKAIIENGFAQGLKNADIYKQVKDAKLFKRMRAEIEKGDTNLFKKQINDSTIGLINEDIYHIEKLGHAKDKLANLEAGKASLAKKKEAFEIKQLTAARRAAFPVGLSSIFQAQTATQAYKATGMAIRDLTIKTYAAEKEQNRFQIALGRTALMGKQAALGIAGAGKMLSFLMGKLMGATAALFAFELLKQAAQWVGLLNKEFQDNKHILAETLEEVKKITKNYKEFQNELQVIPKSVEGVANHWSKAVGIINQYGTALDTIIEKSKILKEATALDNIFGAASSGRAAAAKGLSEIFKGIEEQTGKTLVIDIPIEKNTIRLAIEEQISEYQKRLNAIDAKREDYNKTQLARTAKQRKNIVNKLAEQQKLLLSEAAKSEKGIFKITSKDNLSRFGKVIDIGIEAQNALREGMSAHALGINNVEASMKVIKTEAISLANQVNKLNNKSASRRMLGEDIALGFRDSFQRISKEVASILEQDLGKAQKNAAEGGIRNMIADFDSTVLDTFLNRFNINFGNIDTLAEDLEKAWKELDKHIDRTRNLKFETERLQHVEKGLNAERKRGSISAISKLYENATEQKVVQLLILQSEIKLTEKLFGLVEKDNKKNVNKIAAQLEKEKLLKQEIMQRNAIVGTYKREQEYIKRIQEIENAQLGFSIKKGDVQKQLASINNEFTKSNLKALKEEKANSDAIFALQRAAQITKEQTLEQDLKLLKGTIDIKSHKAKEIELDTLKLNRQKLLLDNLAAELQFRKDIMAAENRGLGEAGGGYYNSSGGFFSGEYWTSFTTQMYEISQEMAAAIKNPVEVATGVFIDATSTFTDTLVDSIMNNEWDGKDEGVSMATAIREALKNSLRETIGSAIKDNMNQAIARMIGTQDPQLAAIRYQTTLLGANTTALEAATQAYVIASQRMGGSSDGNIINKLFGMGLTKGISPTGTDIVGTPFASGGVVHEPTNALIGEGATSEAVVPLPDNRSIPVKLEGGSSNSVNISQQFDFRGADAGTEHKLRQYAAQIKQETIREITDSISRGGNLAKVVGRR